MRLYCLVCLGKYSWCIDTLIWLPSPSVNCYMQECSYKPHPTQAIKISAFADVNAEERRQRSGLLFKYSNNGREKHLCLNGTKWLVILDLMRKTDSGQQFGLQQHWLIIKWACQTGEAVAFVMLCACVHVIKWWNDRDISHSCPLWCLVEFRITVVFQSLSGKIVDHLRTDLVWIMFNFAPFWWMFLETQPV